MSATWDGQERRCAVECSQKGAIDKLYEYHDKKMGDLHTIELRQIEIQGLVLETKRKIENGMTSKIDKTHDTILRLEPVIAHHQEFITNMETMGWWVSRILIAAAFGMFVWAIKSGFSPKI